MKFIFGLLMFASSLFLILLVLVQRGRGGGLSGAFGGMGGQSAFGAKAGDTFTKVTIGSATVWILVCMIATGLLARVKPEESILTADGANGAATQNIDDDLNVPAIPSDDSEPGDAGDAIEAVTNDAIEAADAKAADAKAADADSGTAPAEVTTDTDVADPAPGE